VNNFISVFFTKNKKFQTMKRIYVLFALAFSFSVQSFAQVKTPAPSAGAKVMQTVGMTDITVEYSRPSARGRKIMGNLVPFGEVWRTGANQVTKITLSGDVSIQGETLKKGSYAILTIPSQKTWEVHFFTYEKSSWSSYTKKEATLIVKTDSKQSEMKMESFSISFDGMDAGKANMYFAWENTVVPLAIDTKVDAAVMKSIDKMLAGPSAGDYYTMGSYIYDSGREGKELEQALEYVQKATKVEEPRFWQVRKEALILAKLGKTKEAIKTAKLSMALAEKANNKDYVKMNRDSIDEWSGKSMIRK
jgi:hypothetical protein